MSETAKYLPKTAAALAKLQESAALLEQSADISATEQQQLKESFPHCVGNLPTKPNASTISLTL